MTNFENTEKTARDEERCTTSQSALRDCDDRP